MLYLSDELKGTHLKREGKNRCDPQLIYPPRHDKTAHMRERGLTRQLNERVVPLVLAELHAGGVYAMCAGTDQFRAGSSAKRQIFSQATFVVSDCATSLSEGTAC